MNQNVSVIGSSDGPTALYIANKISFGFINIFGLIIVGGILVFNIVYVIKNKTELKPCSNKIMCIIEQIGRYSSMFFMVFNVGLLEYGFCSELAHILYLVINQILFILYGFLWVPYNRKKTLYRALPLAIIPTLIFLLSGILLRHYLLVLSAVLFGIGHIYVTCKTH